MARKKVKLNEKFISEWEKEECLWNMFDASYHNRDKRTESMKRLATNLEMDVSEVKTKLNSLRTYYTKELAKEKSCKGGMGTAEWYYSKWPHFASMKFLKDSITTRRTSSTIGTSINESFNETTKEEKAHVHREDGSEDGTGSSGEDNGDTDNHESNPSKRGREETETRLTNRPLQKNVPSKEDQLLDKAIDIISNRKRKKQKQEDPEDVFGRHVANQLREITNIPMKEYAKLQIQQLLFNIRFGQFVKPASPEFRVINISDNSLHLPSD